MHLKDQLEKHGAAIVEQNGRQYWLQQRAHGILVDVYEVQSRDFKASDRWWIGTGSTESNLEQFNRRVKQAGKS